MDPNLEKFRDVCLENVRKGRQHVYNAKRMAMVHAEDYLYTRSVSYDQQQLELRQLEKEIENGLVR